MDIDFDDRTIRLGVGELAQFRLGPRDAGSGRVGRWRMQTGSEWHRRLQDEAESSCTAAAAAPRFEVAVSGTVVHGGWRIGLHGRIDQVLLNGDRTILREVKTLSQPLPQAEGVLRAMYPGYFAQAAAYQALCGLNPALGLEGAEAELYFVDIGEGTRQQIPAGDGARAVFDVQIALLCEFADARLKSRERLLAADIAAPFDVFRAGQERVSDALREASEKAKVLLWEAPTGFGKTACALYHALTGMRDGRYERTVYLTGRSTGQLQVLREMESRWPDVARLQQMRSRAEHAIRSTLHTCGEGPSCRSGVEEAWARSGLHPAELVADSPLPLEKARALGEKTGVCPFEITRSVLPFSDLWVGDLNYVFHPRANGVFLDQPGFDPGRTLLVVDEAHNLPARAADAWSSSLEAGHLENLCIEIGFGNPSAKLRRALDGIQSYVARLPRSDRHDDTTLYELRDMLREYAELLQEGALDAEALRPGAEDALWELADALLPLENESLELLMWSPSRGKLEITCLDASREIAAQLKSFGGVLMMSATLRPLDNLLSACGLDVGDAFFLRSAAPWRGMAYEVAVDLRADTRLKARRRSIPLTAETIADMREVSHGPVAAFFPSYKYAQSVADALDDLGLFLRVAIQPRGLDLEGQRSFVEDSLGGVDVLMLVLGSGFTEGIDALGGRISHAIVVGPALPEADAVQSARMENAGGSRGRAFHDVYIVPGIRKVNQAMGRLVRAPGQGAKVLLHCRRFAEPDYEALLDEDFRPQERVSTREGLRGWL